MILATEDLDSGVHGEAMPPKMSPRTQELVEKVFGPTQAAEATRYLEDECGNNVPLCAENDEFQMERIRFAAIKASKGNLKKLLKAIDMARIDWRDLLMRAGFASDVNQHDKWAKETLETEPPSAPLP